MLQKEPELVGIHLVVGLDVCNLGLPADAWIFLCINCGVCRRESGMTRWSCAHVILCNIWLF